MKFAPKSESELARAALLPAGEYDFEVMLAEDTKSKTSGADMIKIKLGIYEGDKITRHVFDYLLPSMEAKLRHFCDSVGLLKEYEAGTLTADACKGRAGKVKLVVDEKDPAYPPKNTVRDYVVRKAKPIGKVDEAQDDDIPF